MSESRGASDYEAMGKVFIAGTGRSGTTIVHNIIGRHPAAFLVPFESKFVVEGDGLRALVERLTDPIPFSTSDLALNRFIEWTGAVRETDNERVDRLRYFDRIGADNYFPPWRAYIDALVAFQGGPDYCLPRTFDDRGELIALSRTLVATMFGRPASAAGKRFWIEKTPFNLLAMDFLWELFPEAAIIHVKRDPRAVAASYMAQEWLPGDRGQRGELLRQIYACWSRLKPRLGLEHRRYLEIAVEDLLDRPTATLDAVASLLGVDNRFPAQLLDRARLDRSRELTAAETNAWAERELRPYFELMGYDPGPLRPAVA
jgi:hypothetical protein